ncbi:MAG: helix-turn-helix transcriptional regulator [candidate division WOR-3 bacterium]
MKKTAKNRFVFTKRMADLLRQVRKEANLTQTEVAERIGMASTGGNISHLERGIIKNPPLGTILLYLSACSVPWQKFFAKLETITFFDQHQKVIASIKLPRGKAKQKIERDVARFAAGIKYPRRRTQKPLTTEKQEAMAKEFARYRMNIEKIEAAVHKILCDFAPGPHTFPFYKDCARAFFSALLKYYGKDQKKLNQKLSEIINYAVSNGLRKEILLKIKAKVLAEYRKRRES